MQEEGAELYSEVRPEPPTIDPKGNGALQLQHDRPTAATEATQHI